MNDREMHSEAAAGHLEDGLTPEMLPMIVDTHKALNFTFVKAGTRPA